MPKLDDLHSLKQDLRIIEVALKNEDFKFCLEEAQKIEIKLREMFERVSIQELETSATVLLSFWVDFQNVINEIGKMKAQCASELRENVSNRKKISFYRKT